MKNTLVLTLNDLAIAVKNKTLLLVLFIPIFVFVALNLVDSTDAEVSVINIGMLQDQVYTAEMTQAIKAAHKSIAVTWLHNKEQGLRLLKEQQIDGLVSRHDDNPASLTVLVLKRITADHCYRTKLERLTKSRGRSPAQLDCRDQGAASKQRATRDLAHLDLDGYFAGGFYHSPCANRRGKGEKAAVGPTANPDT